MNLTEFFNASIKLQEYGYKINTIDEYDKTYYVRFAFAHVCSRLSFGGVQYDVEFHKGCPIQSVFAHRVHKMLLRQMEYVIDTTKDVHSIDEVVDFIISDIQKLEEKEKEKERQKVLAKLTQREKELLGLSGT